MPDRLLRMLIAGYAAALFLAVGGCSLGGSVRIEAAAGRGVLEPGIVTCVYDSSDPNTADVYLTDLAREQLDPGVPADQLTGVIAHVRMFLRPKAGSTPIESTASNATVRCFVLAGGVIGEYGGGAFLMPGSTPGGATFSGSISHGTVEYITGTPGFADRLGPSTMRSSFRAEHNPGLVRLIEIRLAQLRHTVERVGAE